MFKELLSKILEFLFGKESPSMSVEVKVQKVPEKLEPAVEEPSEKIAVEIKPNLSKVSKVAKVSKSRKVTKTKVKSTRGVITDEQKAKIKELIASGKSQASVALEVGVSVPSVKKYS